MVNSNNLPLLQREKSNNNTTGQSLIELLVGVALVLIVLLAIATLTTRSVQLADISQYHATAVELAKQGVEEMRVDRNARLWSAFAQTQNLTPTNHDQHGIRFVRTIRKSRLNAEKLEIVVEVSWQDTAGDHVVDQTTLLSNWQ